MRRPYVGYLHSLADYLEDISAPNVVRLRTDSRRIDIPVFHDDQHALQWLSRALLKR